ncbi:hypothetical protein LPJ38_23210 [Bradyrhizobium daqingense]|uniref:Uncharacterized protein n=1 Tax=Bradyrhizobium daqingense TaxID=993502 RepID=A0A562LFX4_9BRAD|nr:hypothetical protein [Bradyrhizobium daqingense]TWI06506.1 hypothetical protein IQ17_02721 [Bradyrhizobium daqingense]UFS86574.1 hypothetical protein LPJ38_23210 [Bradyrhizobium daqingense]
MNKKTLTIAATILTIAGATSAFAAELPTYEANGFPVSPLQVRVLGAGHVEQQVTAPTTVATAHQLKVLGSRNLKTADVTTGAAR